MSTKGEYTKGELPRVSIMWRCTCGISVYWRRCTCGISVYWRRCTRGVSVYWRRCTRGLAGWDLGWRWHTERKKVRLWREVDGADGVVCAWQVGELRARVHIEEAHLLIESAKDHDRSLG